VNDAGFLAVLLIAAAACWSLACRQWSLGAYALLSMSRYAAVALALHRPAILGQRAAGRPADHHGQPDALELVRHAAGAARRRREDVIIWC
jgi:hypothetical protein